MVRNHPWTIDHELWFSKNPNGSHEDFEEDHPEAAYTWESWRQKRASILGPGRSVAKRRPENSRIEGLRRREDNPAKMPDVYWDKKEEEFNWRDVLGPLESLQQIAKASSGSQDSARIHVLTKRPIPLLWISDWHIGSWGTSYRKVAEITELIQRRGLMIAVLGDMLQMSIKLRNVLEVSDNALVPRLQVRFIESWLEEIIPYIAFSCWDNHVVMREEAVTGFSRYAELLKDKTVYHSGIGHVDLRVGGEVDYQTYRIASSHRFRGNSYMNPTHGQMRYGRMEGQDREIIVAGDSHVPAVTTYADGATPKCAINCGSLQVDSGYAKRHYSLHTHDWMPVVEFWPDRHLFMPYPSLTHWLEKHPEDENETSDSED